MFKKLIIIILIGVCVIVIAFVLSRDVFVKLETSVPVVSDDLIVNDENNEVVSDDDVEVKDDNDMDDADNDMDDNNISEINISDWEDGNVLKVDTSNWKTYQNEIYRYEIKYPQSWVIETHDGKYGKGIKKPQEKADWIQLALHTKDKQKIKKYGESMMASVSMAVINKESSDFTVEDYLKDFGFDLNSGAIKSGCILLTRGIAEVWMNIKEENFKGHRTYVIQTAEEHGYYLYFEYNQNIYEISSLYGGKKEVSKQEILEIINTFKFTK